MPICQRGGLFRIDNYGAIWYNYNIRLVRENDFVPLKYCEARGLEQLGIIGYNTLNLAKDMNLFGRNWINGIADTNVNKFLYMKAAMNFIYNEITNEYLNSIGS